MSRIEKIETEIALEPKYFKQKDFERTEASETEKEHNEWTRHEECSDTYNMGEIWRVYSIRPWSLHPE